MAYLNSDQLAAYGFKSIGRNVRISDKASIYNSELIEISDNSRIDDFCVVSGLAGISKNVHIAVFCDIAGGENGVILMDFSGLAYGCPVFSQSVNYSEKSLTNPIVPDKYKFETKAKILIESHSIVGACSIIHPGVTLEEGTAVGVKSMVTK